MLRAEFVASRPPTPSSHASTIVATTDGLVCAWFGGLREGARDVAIWAARRDAEGWSEPTLVAAGESAGLLRRRLPCWNPVLFQPSHGPLLLFYKVGPSPSRWWGMSVASFDHGRTWGAPQRLPPEILGPIKNKPIELPCGTLICPSSCERGRWRIHVERCDDLGKSWRRGPPINDGRDFQAIQPTILDGADGRLEMLCRTRSGVIAECWSDDGGRTWSKLAATVLPNPDSGIDAVRLRDGRRLLVYNHTQVGRTPLNLAVSEDGRRWRAAGVLESDPGEFSYPAIVEGRDGSVHVTYTWNRRRIRHVRLSAGARFDGPDLDGGGWPHDAPHFERVVA